MVSDKTRDLLVAFAIIIALGAGALAWLVSQYTSFLGAGYAGAIGAGILTVLVGLAVYLGLGRRT